MTTRTRRRQTTISPDYCECCGGRLDPVLVTAGMTDHDDCDRPPRLDVTTGPAHALTVCACGHVRRVHGPHGSGTGACRACGCEGFTTDDERGT